MTYQQLIITTTTEHAEPIADWLSEHNALSVSLESGNQQEVFQLQPEDSPLWETVMVKALYNNDTDVTQIMSRLSSSFEIQFEHQIEALEDQDWVRLTQQQFKPQYYANDLCVAPAWEQHSIQAKHTVLIDPGLAFGTGNHATTSLCLEWLANHPPQNKAVIDYGCGSGILALAALALGAKQVHAVDHDPQAIEATHNNSQHNNYANSQNLFIALPEDFTAFEADVVVANILANPLIELAEHISSLVKSGGKLILSGILSAETDSVISAYQNVFTVDDIQHKDEWACISLTKL